LKRGEASLIELSPLPLVKGKGINPVRNSNGVKGIGLIRIKGEGLVNDLVYTNTAQN